MPSFRHHLGLLGAATLTGSLVLAGATPAAAGVPNLLLDGGFESPAIGGGWSAYYDGDALGPWSVSAPAIMGGVDILRYIAPDAGLQSVDLNAGGPGSIEQTVDLPAARYRLAFALAGNPDTDCGPQGEMRMHVEIGTRTVASYTFDTTGHTLDDPGWVDMSVGFSASGSTAIRFVSDAPATCGGSMIDSVRLVPVAPQMTCSVGAVGATATIRLDRYVHCSFTLPKGATFARWGKDGFARVDAGSGYAVFRATEVGPGSITLLYVAADTTHRLTASYTIKRG